MATSVMVGAGWGGISLSPDAAIGESDSVVIGVVATIV
jgi:hypothetical protein